MTFHVYKDDANEYRWRLKAANGKIIADSGEGYPNKEDCLHAIELVKHASGAPIDIEPPNAGPHGVGHKP